MMKKKKTIYIYKLNLPDHNKSFPIKNTFFINDFFRKLTSWDMCMSQSVTASVNILEAMSSSSSEDTS